MSSSNKTTWRTHTASGCPLIPRQHPRPGARGLGKKRTLTTRREFQQGGAAPARAPAKSKRNKSKAANRRIRGLVNRASMSAQRVDKPSRLRATSRGTFGCTRATNPTRAMHAARPSRTRAPSRCTFGCTRATTHNRAVLLQQMRQGFCVAKYCLSTK